MDDAAAQAASEDEIVGVVRQLRATNPNGVTLDALSNALKSRGHRRPPGSLRLVTRVRRIKQLEVGRNGVILLRDDDDSPAPAAPSRVAAIEFDDYEGGSGASVADEATELGEGTGIDPDVEDGDDDEPEGDLEATDATPAEGAPGGARRRRRRRGGRRRRGRNGNGSGGGTSSDTPVEAAAHHSEPVAS